MRKKILLGFGFLVIIFLGYGLISNKKASIGDDLEGNSQEESIPFFKIVDLKGNDHRLADYQGSPVIAHFMSVSCGGEFSKLNDNQLKQLNSVCGDLCDENHVTIFTILVSTCETTDLSQLYDLYNITWILGNDYQDAKLDVVEAFSEFEPADGMIILMDGDLVVNKVLDYSVTSEDLLAEILALEG